jgi:flagellar motor switch protein FliM
LPDEILTSAEIDDIIGALAAPEEKRRGAVRRSADYSGESVKLYDFRTADRFPKEQMRTLHIIFETFAQLFSTRMATAMRGDAECTLRRVTEMSFKTYVSALEQPMVLEVFKAPPMAGNQLFALSPDMSYIFINRLLGGARPVKHPAKQQFTEIELALIRRISRDIAHVYEIAWEKVVRINWQHEKLETSPQFVQIVQSEESVAVVELDIRVGDEQGDMSFCLPHTAIEPIIQYLSTRTWYESATIGETESARGEQIRARLYRTSIPLSASFNETEASVEDILTLNVGDVIRLSHKTGAPVNVSVAHIPKFRATLGERGHRRALCLTEILKAEDPDRDAPDDPK